MDAGGAYDDYSGALKGDNYNNDSYDDPKKDDPIQNDVWSKDEPEDLRTGQISSSSLGHEKELDEREAALIARERQLIEKNQRLVQREKQVNDESIPEDNWPCSLYAITYHSIKKEIPAPHQSFIRNQYRLVKLTMFALVWNFTIVAVLYLEDAPTITSTNLLWACIYLVCGVPGAWKLWYRAIYSAIMKEKNVKFVQYFLFFGCHTIFSITATIGVVQTSMCGFLMMLDAMKKNTGTSICAMVAFATWVIIAVSSIILFRSTWRLYRSKGGDLKADASVAAGNLASQGLMN